MTQNKNINYRSLSLTHLLTWAPLKLVNSLIAFGMANGSTYLRTVGLHRILIYPTVDIIGPSHPEFALADKTSLIAICGWFNGHNIVLLVRFHAIWLNPFLSLDSFT